MTTSRDRTPQTPGTAAAEDRGTTTVSASAVERIAARAATEMPDIGGSARRFRGVALGKERATRPVHVRALVDRDSASLAVHLSVGYPVPLAAATEAVREHLITRVGELAGLRVRRVDITVTALHTAAEHRGVR
ncbi:putative alkaline shock family protein YloU [Crossiella equi]|uniref:Alkaline shock family protein YloU n=1 Tax=Crossiella equi TaxID=130796 RepID=A0ABS5A7H4_9PSEU|nr:Asp23/Gls24 family envelope stress response protein [Crossiella equi]MBP2472546.1 putative alkaline shock family protein YloU [Crossiella equi]